jgi:predicted transposase YdaD
MGDKDIGGKYLIDRDPEGWIRWLLNDPTLEVLHVVSPEFQFVGRRGDSLLHARGPQGEFGALAELQLEYDSNIPARVQNYTALGRQKLGLPIVPIVVYLTPPPAGVEVATAYHAEFMGLVTHQDFKVIKMWEIDAAQALALDLPVGILPYVPLMAGADEAIVRACVARIRAEPDHAELEAILALFAMIRLDAKTVEQLLRWDMSVLEKSPLYQQILEKGREEGLERGLERGLEQGLEQGLERSILRILQRRFGAFGTDLPNRLAELPPAELEELLDEAIMAVDYPAFADYLTTLEARRA